MEKQCELHLVKMTGKDGKYGFFYSHKLEDGSWCNGKPKTPNNFTANMERGYIQNEPEEKSVESTEPDWDKIAVGKVASNIAVALVERGIALSEIEKQLTAIFSLSEKIVAYKRDIPF